MSFQAYINNIKAKTGKSPEDFKKIAEKKGLLKPGIKAGEIVKWLKEDFDLGHGHAMAIYAVFKNYKPAEEFKKNKEKPIKKEIKKTAPNKVPKDQSVKNTNKKSVNKKLKFHTTILQGRKTATGIKIPEEIVESLGAGKRPPVRITINGYTYRNTIAVMGGAFMVGVSAEHRKGAGVEGGDEVDVFIELDTEVRIVEVPQEFQKVLNNNADAKKKFESLSNSKKQWLIIPIKDAKTEETKQRRIEKAINLLTEDKV